MSRGWALAHSQTTTGNQASVWTQESFQNGFEKWIEHDRPPGDRSLVVDNRKLKQQRRRRLRKRHWKSEFALSASNLISRIPCQMMAIVLGVDSKTVWKFREEKEVQKSLMHVQSCCFANLNTLLFLPFSLPSQYTSNISLQRLSAGSKL